MSESPHIIANHGTLWVLSKPAGTLVHATAADETDLMNWLMERQSEVDHVAPCHRLDKGTSGVVLCSSDAGERGDIGKLFAEGQIKKTYQALVYGVTHKKGTLKRPLKDSRRGRSTEAVTQYKRLEVFGSFSLLEVRPKTGKRHQIRRHLQGIGHPIVGDKRYGPRRFRRVPAYPERMWLHAMRLELPDGQVYEAPLPQALEEHLFVLRQRGEKNTD